MEENRNQQEKRTEQSNRNQSTECGQQNVETGNDQNISTRNPQSGKEWNNYQSRELSDNTEDTNENRSTSDQNSTIGNP
jgi:hypothetical protein